MDETIDLRKIIEILLKGKWVIFGCMLSGIILAGIYSTFIIKDSYTSKATIQIEKVSGTENDVLMQALATEYTSEKYFKLITDENVTALENDGTNYIDLSVSASSADEAKSNLEKKMNDVVKELDENSNDRLQKIEKMYALRANSFEDELHQISNHYNELITKHKLSNILHTEYLTLSNVGITLTKEQSEALSKAKPELQREINRLQTQIAVVSIERQNAIKYEKILTHSRLTNNNSEQFISIVKKPDLPEGSNPTNSKLNILVGLFVGLMLGLIIIFMRSYLQSAKN